MKKTVRGINNKAGLGIMKSSIAGNTLISVLFFVLALALIGKPAMDFFDSWKDRKAMSETSDRLAAIDEAIRNYVTANGRYPCPAVMANTPFDTPNFGVEQLAECNTDTETLIDRSLGHDSLAVRAGAVPVRTLGLPDLYIADGYGHRYVYTVTEQFTRTVPALPNLDTIAPAIMLVDDNNNVATRDEGNIIFAVTSMGDDIRGAYNLQGTQLAACDAASRAGENCDMNATLKNSVNKSLTEGNQKFTQNVRFKTGNPCLNSFVAPPNKMAYLLDTSGSMYDDTPYCPPNYGGPCDRTDAAHWAMRRAVKSRQLQTADDKSMTTDFLTFVKNPSKNLNDGKQAILPTDNIENKLVAEGCPPSLSAMTPLGDHIAALAAHIGDKGGATVDRPNVIMVVSDGINTAGKEEPLDVAKQIYKDYKGALVVHIIDMGNNPTLRQVAEATTRGLPQDKQAKYFQASNPKEILDYMMKLTGSCENLEIPEPPDQRNCTNPRRKK